MRNERSAQTSLIRRITVDEKLSDDLIRILVSTLKDNITEFNDDLISWDEEQEDFAQPDNYRQKFGMTRSNTETWPWESLREGYVFLQGGFRINRNRKSGKMFIVDSKRRSFRRIDPMIKERIKQTYMAVMRRSA